MRILHLIIRINAVAFCTLPCTLMAAAQSPAPVTTQRPGASIAGDPVAWRRDPFIGSLKMGAGATSTNILPQKTGMVVSKQDQELDFHLQGIMLVDKEFHALINGRSVKVGEKIGGVSVKQIRQHQVVVLNDRNELIIYDIYRGRIKRGKP